MKTKRVLCPERLRHATHRFSWIDQRLVRDGHIARCGPQALALYLLLVTVADAQGLSYYSNKTAARLLSLNEAQLREARHSLLAAGLIAYESPLYVPELLEIIEHYHGERYEVALNQIEDLGVVRESNTRSDALKALVMDAIEEFRVGQKPIIIAPVQRDGKDFARAIREEMKSAGCWAGRIKR